MHTSRVLSFAPSLLTPAAAKVGKLASFALLAGSLAMLSPIAHADDFNTVLGAGIGAVAGAAIGKSVGGRNGAILGAGAGGLVGASIASQQYSGGYSHNTYPAQTYYQQPNTYYQPPVAVYQAPQPYYREVQPITYYQPQPQYRVVQPITYYQVQPQHRHWREERRERHHDHQEYNRGYDNGYYRR